MSSEGLYLEELTKKNLSVLESIYSSSTYILSLKELSLLKTITNNYNVYKVLGMNSYKKSNYYEFMKYYLEALQCINETIDESDNETYENKTILLEVTLDDIYTSLQKISSDVHSFKFDIDMNILEIISNKYNLLCALHIRACVYVLMNKHVDAYMDYLKLYELNYENEINDEYEKLENIIYSSSANFTIPKDMLDKLKSHSDSNFILKNYYQKMNPKQYVAGEYFDDELLKIIEYNLNIRNYTRAKFIIENNFNTPEKIDKIVKLLDSTKQYKLAEKIVELI